MKALIRFIPLYAVLVAAPLLAADWRTLANCQYVTDPANTADSFQVRCGGKNQVIRLYAVAGSPDDFAANRDRYGLTKALAQATAQSATEFTKKQLEGKPFTVITRDQPAGKSGAEYAYVLVGNADLGQTLVAHGLARVDGLRPARPGAGALTYLGALRDAETQARRAGHGAWSHAQAHRPATNLQRDTGYCLSAANIRHNPRCRHYELRGNAPCGPKDGTPCKICGG
jgi:endonuclease YncB( thermonuclease family)